MRDLRLIAALLGMLVLFALGLVLRELQSVMLPFVIAVFLSIIFRPLVLMLTRRRVPIAVALVAVFIVIAGLLFGLAVIIYTSADSFITALPRYQDRLSVLLASLSAAVEGVAQRFGYQMSDLRIIDAINASSITSVVSSGLGAVFTSLGSGFMILLFMIFILAGSGQMATKIEAAFRDEHATRIASVITKIDEKVRRYLVTKTLISFATGALCALLLWIIGVDFPLLWGFITFLLNFIPNVGSLFSTIFPFSLALLQFDSPLRAVVVLVLLIAVQNVMGNIIEPKLMAFSLNLSPLLVLVSLIFWGWLWGVWGMIVAVPIMSMLKIIFEHVEPLSPIAALMSSSGARKE